MDPKQIERILECFNLVVEDEYKRVKFEAILFEFFDVVKPEFKYDKQAVMGSIFEKT